MDDNTICAISTPLGEGGIGIVRLSGPESFEIVNRIFFCRERSKKSYPRSRYLYYGYIKNLEGITIDEVLVSFMKAPSTYTREDVVEINCHSGLFTLRSVHKLVLEAGARMAEPGEFTKRAFINGRIDLTRAEAVMSMVRAKSEQAVIIAAKCLQGELMSKVEQVREAITATRAPLEAYFDYPQELDSETVDDYNLSNELEIIEGMISSLMSGVEKNRALQNGISVAIIGKPNVGKSSVLNNLLQKQRAIVHEKPGTTRDLLEGYLNLGGYPIKLVDTAGIQGTEDPVEKAGIELSRKAAEKAKMIIAVFDSSEPMDEQDRKIALLSNKKVGLVVVLNKDDLPSILSLDELKKYFECKRIVKTSALKRQGCKALEREIIAELDEILEGGVESENNYVVLERHEEALKKAWKHIIDAKKAIETRPLEIVSLELQNAWIELGLITGETVNEDLLDKVFSEFCLGK